jgi:hypothetical protein
MDDEDWVEKYREKFQERASQKEMEERTQWQRTSSAISRFESYQAA